jgi:predicted amidohydrolase YtcJ
LGYGLGLSNAWLTNAKNWEEVVNRLIENQKQYPTEWVKGRGWNQNEWTIKQFPTNDLLNKAFPNKPVYIVRIDGHAAIANQKALELAGVNNKTTVNGGEIVKINGNPTGVLIDNAMELVRKCIPESTKEEKARRCLTHKSTVLRLD